jgi:hypothetical protein
MPAAKKRKFLYEEKLMYTAHSPPSMLETKIESSFREIMMVCRVSVIKSESLFETDQTSKDEVSWTPKLRGHARK